MHFRHPSKPTLRFLTSGLVGLLYCGAVFADDVTGSDSLLCYGLSAARCETGEACQAVEPWKLNIPDFVKLDLKGKRIATTATSNEKRETPLQTVQLGLELIANGKPQEEEVPRLRRAVARLAELGRRLQAGTRG